MTDTEKKEVSNIMISNNEALDGTLTCSVCGASGYQNLIRHIKSRHKMTPNSYRSEYPNDKVYTDRMLSNFSRGGTSANIAMKERGTDFSERARKARATELSNDPYSYVNRNRKLFENPSFKERATQRLIKASRFHGDRYQYHGISFRSTWEVKFAEWLDIEGIPYIYEGLSFEYFDPERRTTRTYYPDFYIPDRSLLIEIKPKIHLDNEVVIAKKDAVLKEGYKFKFITQYELSNLSVILLDV